MAINGRVAEVVSDTELAFDVGSDQGVRLDDLVTVLKTITVRDPETNEPLGDVRRPMLRLRVVEVQPALCVAESIDLRGSADDALSVFFQGQRQVKKIARSQRDEDSGTVYVARGMDATIDSAPVESGSGQASASVRRERTGGEKSTRRPASR